MAQVKVALTTEQRSKHRSFNKKSLDNSPGQAWPGHAAYLRRPFHTNGLLLAHSIGIWLTFFRTEILSNHSGDQFSLCTAYTLMALNVSSMYEYLIAELLSNMDLIANKCLFLHMTMALRFCGFEKRFSFLVLQTETVTVRNSFSGGSA